MQDTWRQDNHLFCSPSLQCVCSIFIYCRGSKIELEKECRKLKKGGGGGAGGSDAERMKSSNQKNGGVRICREAVSTAAELTQRARCVCVSVCVKLVMEATTSTQYSSGELFQCVCCALLGSSLTTGPPCAVVFNNLHATTTHPHRGLKPTPTPPNVFIWGFFFQTVCSPILSLVLSNYSDDISCHSEAHR